MLINTIKRRLIIKHVPYRLRINKQNEEKEFYLNERIN